jgi:hypothetical protein
MEKTGIRVEVVANFYKWINTPTNVPAFFDALAALSLLELIHVTLQEDKTAARVAWVELARRRGFLDFTLKLTRVDGEFELDCSAPGFPVSNVMRLPQA